MRVSNVALSQQTKGFVYKEEDLKMKYRGAKIGLMQSESE